MKALHIHYQLALLQEQVGKGQRLVEEAAAVVAKVHDEVAHPLLFQVQGRKHELLRRSARELAQAQESGSVVDHKSSIHGVRGYLGARDFKRNIFRAAPDGDSHLGAGRSLHTPHHTVLREGNSGYRRGVNLEQAVSGLHTEFFGRAAGYHLYDHGRIVRHVELNAYAGKIAGKVFFRLLQTAGRHIHRMRIQGGEGGRHGGVCDLAAVHGIDILLIDGLQHKINLAPVVVLGTQHTAVLGQPVSGHHHAGAEQHPYNQRYEGRTVHISPLFLLPLRPCAEGPPRRSTCTRLYRPRA